MSKDRKKLLHIHSSVNDKQPTPETLEFGELGVNIAEGNAFISTKNIGGEVVRFSEDGTIIDWMEYKEVFPYEAYVRGSNAASSGVTESDLVNNKSNIIVKLNQVVAKNTEYDEKVNGAKDIYGNLINPIGTDNYRDGAGLAIDMSRYAMIGANPSFSSLTTTCNTTLQGQTTISGSTSSSCGNGLNVNVQNVCIEATSELNEYGVEKTNVGKSCNGNSVSNNTSVNGKKILISATNGDNTVDIDGCSRISGRTNDFVITECTNNAGKVEIDTTNVNVSASTSIVKSCDKISLHSTNITLSDSGCSDNGQVTVETNDLCLVGETKATLYGNTTNVGVDCDGSAKASETNVNGTTINITGNTINESAVTINESATTINEIANNYVVSGANACIATSSNVSIGGDASTKIGTDCNGNVISNVTEINATSSITINSPITNITGDTHIGGNTYISGTTIISGDTTISVNCPSLTNNTLDEALCEAFNRSVVSVTASTATPAGTNYQKYTVRQDSTNRSVDIAIPNVTISSTTSGLGDNILKSYDIMYDGVSRGKIDIPKDFLVKSGSVKVVERPDDPYSGAQVGDKYIDLVLNVLSGSSEPDQHVYIPIKDLVSNMEFKSTSGSISIATATTQGSESVDLNVAHPLKWSAGAFTADTTGYDGSSEKTITVPTSLSHLTHGNLTLTHNGTSVTYDPSTATSATLAHSALTATYEATSGKTGSVTYNTSAATGISIPTCVNHLGRSTLAWNYGSTTTATNGTYDPGANCNGTSSSTVIIPKTIGNITDDVITINPSDSCITVNGDINSNNVIKGTAFYASSDLNLKENINDISSEDIDKVSNVNLKEFNFKSDENKEKKYGVIAQDLQVAGLGNIVEKGSDGFLSVDYTSFLLLKIASLEKKIDELTNKIEGIK